MEPISYVSDQTGDYCAALPKCKTLPDLMTLLHSYHTIFADALEAAPTNDVEFAAFMAGLRKERRGQFAGEDYANRYGAVMMPELMLHVGMVAQKFGVPWGCAFIRLREAGRIAFDDGGVARWVKTPNVEFSGVPAGR